MKTSRRRFLRSAIGCGAFAILGGRASAQAAKARIKFALVGINHEHVFRMVKAVRDGGGELAMVLAEDADPNHAAEFFRENPGVRRARDARGQGFHGGQRRLPHAGEPRGRAPRAAGDKARLLHLLQRAAAPAGERED